MAQIHELIPKVMADIGAVAKGRKNQQQGYAFRGIDEMYNAVQPALVKHGVFVCPSVTAQVREERQTKSGGNLIYTVLTVKHTFYAADGSSVDVVTVGEAMDSGDKSANKAMSAAMKYALIELFSIPTEEDNDTENHSHDVRPKGTPAPAPQQKPTAPPASGEQLKTIADLIGRVKAAKAMEVKWFNAAKVTRWEDMPADKAEKVIDKLTLMYTQQNAAAA